MASKDLPPGFSDHNRDEYSRRHPGFSRLAANLEQALAGFLLEAGIPYLTVTSRVKTLESMATKVVKKQYPDPFVQCEDLCGVRVICYYPSDLVAIGEIIKREFVVHEAIDKSSDLAANEFGYRSVHFIVSVNPKWLAAPNYRALDGIRAEIQVRTVLMHAWAEIEHKLAYKAPQDVPTQFRRTLSRLSAKFEEADEQFQMLRDGLQDYQAKLATEAKAVGRFDVTTPLSLDSLAALLAFYFPDRSQGTLESVQDLLSEVGKFGLTMADLVGAVERASEVMPTYEKDMKHMFIPKTTGDVPRWGRVGALRAALDLTRAGYFEGRVGNIKLDRWKDSLNKHKLF